MMEINNLEFVNTCRACPEQYNVLRDGVQVGYVRLRDSELRVDVPDCGELTIMRTDLPWDDTDASGGEFSGSARMAWLERVADAINSYGGKADGQS